MVNQLLGRKVGMTQIYRDNGECVPVTVLEVGPCTVVQVKTEEKDGYSALQVAFGNAQKNTRLSKAEQGHFKKAGVDPQQLIQEISWDGREEFKAGDKITVEALEKFNKVDVIGTSKGRGFTGVISRWNFGRQPASRGSQQNERRGGGINGGVEGGKTGGVVKGKMMPGHWGVERVTVRNMNVAHIDKDKNFLCVNGGVPGPNGGFVIVQEANWVAPKESKLTKKGKK